MDRPPVVTTVRELRQAVAAERGRGKRIGLVPTMGALHAGHLSLVQASASECDFTVVTIFVNPTQFGPNEDFARYPRTLESDLDALAGCEVPMVVFAPPADEVYPPGHATAVEVEGVAQPLEGVRRPGHFRGVATVVLKLFNMAGADCAYFGQKDFQQVRVIEQMVADLDVPIEIRMCPIVREGDGLAMSSRNVYLSPEARRQALSLSESLRLAQQMVAQGRCDAETITRRMRETILAAGPLEIDYVALVDPVSLEEVEAVRGRTLAALAVRVGATRLIDNCLLDPAARE